MSRVLLVDDEPNIRWTMSEILRREGYEPLTASDFDSAVDVIRSQPLDAAVVDVVLPRTSGIELLKVLRSHEPYIPVIMITGEPNLSQVPEIVRSGAYDFICKPVVKEVLVRSVARAVEKKQLIDEKRRLEQSIRRHAEQLEELVAERNRELAEAHTFLKTVLDSSTEYALIATDLQGRITLFNRGAELLFGYTAERASGGLARELVGSDYRPELFLGRAQEVDVEPHKEMQLRRSGGTSFLASVTMTPICRPGGDPSGWLGITRDITAEREAENAVRKMQSLLDRNEKMAALGRVAAQVAHEVKNPLAGLRLYALHLRSKVSDVLRRNEVELIDKIIDAINHVSETVEQVLNFARPIALTPHPIDINRLVSDAVKMLETQVGAGGINVKLDLADRKPTGLLDEAAIRSTLINLMLNGIQAMPDGGTLTVSTAYCGERLCLTVSDTGCGISKEELDNVFEPFYTTKNQGLGLGLPYAKKIIDQHQGTILIESKPGAGTRVDITLPTGE